MPELSNYAICYEAIQRVYRNAVIRKVRLALEETHGEEWLAGVEKVFQKEWQEVADAAQEIRVTGFVAGELIDDFDCLGVNHFHNLFAKFFNDLFPRASGTRDNVRDEERRAVLRYAKEVNDYRNAMSHPSEKDLPERDAKRLLDSAHRLLLKIDKDAAKKILEYEKQLLTPETPPTVPPPGPPPGPGPGNPPIVSVQQDVLVVPAGRYARNDYEKYHAYMCQPNRAFRPVPRMAFYEHGVILRYVPTVEGVIESVSFSDRGYEDIERARLDSAAAEKARKLLRTVLDREGSWASHRAQFKLVLLSGPEDPETFLLRGEIVNDKRSGRGRTAAFVQAQRYVSFARLQQHPTKTSQLE